MLEDLVRRNRSYRRFYEDVPVSKDDLKHFVNLARLSASGRNAQPLKYYISNDVETNAQIFSTLGWAAYFRDWDGPVESERPAAYIILLGDKNIASNFYCDHGIAAQSILLGATEKGYGGCIIATIQQKKLREFLSLPEYLEIMLVIALGQPKEDVVIEQMRSEHDIKYWRDSQEIHHVPKRNLEDIIVNL